MPLYEEKVVTPPKLVHIEVKDGKTIYVEGPRKNPYQGVSPDSLKLSSRIAAGTFENHEGAPNRLEKAQGSDVAVAQVEAAEREYESAKENARAAVQRKRIKEELEKTHPEVAKLVDD
jgi:hypothetical protein